MTYTKAIEELIVAIGYALDASMEYKSAEHRKESRERSEKILKDVIAGRPFEPDPIIIKKSNVKAVHIDTNQKITKYP